MVECCLWKEDLITCGGGRSGWAARCQVAIGLGLMPQRRPYWLDFELHPGCDKLLPLRGIGNTPRNT